MCPNGKKLLQFTGKEDKMENVRENDKNDHTCKIILRFSEENVVSGCLFATVLFRHCCVFDDVFWVVARWLLTG